MAGTWEALVVGPGRPGDRRRARQRAAGRHRAAAARRQSRSCSRWRRITRWRRSQADRRRDAAAPPRRRGRRQRAAAVAAHREPAAGPGRAHGGDMQAKIEALIRCLGCGFVPEPMAREHIARRPAGRQGRAAAEPADRARLRLARRCNRRSRARRRSRAGAAMVAAAAGKPGDAAGAAGTPPAAAAGGGLMRLEPPSSLSLATPWGARRTGKGPEYLWCGSWVAGRKVRRGSAAAARRRTQRASESAVSAAGCSEGAQP